jgi:hypothetical protein
MMQKARILLAMMILSLTLSFAADDSSLGDYYESSTGFISSSGRDFADAAGAAGGTGTGTARTIYDSFSPGQCGTDWVDASGGLHTVIGGWYAPTVLVALIVVLGISIFYMLGQLMNSPQLVALAKDELFQTMLTVMRVVFLIGMLGATEIWYSLSVTGSGDPVYNNNKNMMDAAMGFSRLMVSDMMSHYSVLLLYNMVIHTLYSSTMWVGVTWRAMYSFNLGPVLRPLIDMLGSALQYLSLGISEWLLHIVTLCLIKRWTWGLFIPISMLLRAFPYTRPAGEAFFAIMFSLALFYPFMFVFDYEVHKMMKHNLVDSQNAVNSFIQKSGLLSVVGGALVMMFLMAGVFMPFFMGTALNLAFELVRSAVYYIVIMSLLLPFLNIFVTLTAAKEIAAFFRVDVNFMSFLKII